MINFEAAATHCGVPWTTANNRCSGVGRENLRPLRLYPTHYRPGRHHEPVYVLWAYSETKETTLPFFVYSEGAFRYLGMLHPASDDALHRYAAGVNSEAEPSAHYLTEDQLEMRTVLNDQALVEKAVMLRVIVDLNGKPKDVTYVRGPEAERKGAISRAKKRRYDVPPVIRAIHARAFPLCVIE